MINVNNYKSIPIQPNTTQYNTIQLDERGKSLCCILWNKYSRSIRTNLHTAKVNLPQTVAKECPRS